MESKIEEFAEISCEICTEALPCESCTESMEECQKKVLEIERQLEKVRRNWSEAKSELKDFEECAGRRKGKYERLVQRTMELDAENKVLTAKIEKYSGMLHENRNRVNVILGKIERTRQEHLDCLKKIEEFEEMIAEQNEENEKTMHDMEAAKEDYEGQKKDVEILSLGENELKKRVKQLQDHILLVRKDNKSLEHQLKILADEQKLKSGTISLLSASSSLILIGPNDSKQDKTTELAQKMNNQLEEIMQLYREIDNLKERKRQKKLKEALSNKPCKCIIQ